LPFGTVFVYQGPTKHIRATAETDKE